MLRKIKYPDEQIKWKTEIFQFVSKASTPKHFTVFIVLIVLCILTTEITESYEFYP